MHASIVKIRFEIVDDGFPIIRTCNGGDHTQLPLQGEYGIVPARETGALPEPLALGVHVVPVVWRAKYNGFSPVAFFNHLLKIVFQDAMVVLYASSTSFARPDQLSGKTDELVLLAGSLENRLDERFCDFAISARADADDSDRLRRRH